MFKEFKKLKKDTNNYPNELKQDKNILGMEIYLKKNPNKQLNEIMTIQDMKTQFNKEKY